MKTMLTRQGAWLAVALLLLIYAALFFALYAAAASSGSAHPAQAAWWQLRVPGLDQSFADLRTITHGIECLKRGIDPYVSNPCDPWNRLVNYPVVWLRVFELTGVGPRATSWFGTVFGLAYVAAALAFIGRRPLWQGMLYGAAMLSPALMLGVERGNNDLLMFALIVAGLWLALGEGTMRRFGGTALLAIAVILKLFPVFSVAMALNRRRSLLLPALAVGLVGVAYYLSSREVFDAAARNTTREVFYSYGAEVIFIGLERHFGMPGALAAWKATAFAAAGCVGLLLGLWLAFRNSDDFVLGEDRWGAGLPVAAAIYLFTFSLASSYDYRLVFLLLGLPQLMSWATDNDRGAVQRLLSRTAIATILLSLWLSFYTVNLRLIDEAFNWITFILLLAMMTVSGLRFLAWLPRLKQPPSSA